ncbi:AraC family transcriptional regulator [Paenibacillus sp. NPDC058071]|uniref:helix-turn-helix transcriptional regulator n=1 Tax=Paenibacillus sp. NPDC058071 TaxID=3346326 RepID=UPI0036D8F6D1
MAISTVGLTYHYQHPYFRSEAYLYGSHMATARKGWLCGKHVHHMMIEFNLVLKGKQTAVIGAAEHVQEEGDLLIVPPMQLHDFRVEDSEGVQYFTMHVQLPDSSFVELLERQFTALYRRGHPLNEALTPLVREIADALAGELHSRIGLFANLYAIAHRLEQYLEQEGQGRTWKPSMSYLIAKEIEHMVVADEAVEEKQLALDSESNWLVQISHKLGVSRRHAYRVFRQTYGMSPREYLMVLKRQEAMQMLAASNDSIETIAHRIGYENVQSFSRQFAEWTGFTPSEFRKQELDGIHHLIPIEL